MSATKDPRIAELEAEGFVVLRAKSQQAARERLRVAEALKAAAEDRVRSIDAWAQSVCVEERRLSERLTFVYGVARAHGATVEELTS